MKRTILLSLLLLTTLLLHAQLTNEQLGGVYYAYPSVKAKEAPVPDGYKLVYLSHYGRHGSRWVTSDSRYEWVLSHFDDENNLTKQGKKAKRLLEKVYANARGNGGQLTPIGERQHQGIAERMAKRFPALFKDSVRISARSSVVPRCRRSMLAFLPVIQALNPMAKIDAATDSSDMQWMSYESPNEKLLKREPIPSLQISPQRFISNLFKDPSKIADGSQLLSEMFIIASDIQDVEGVKVSLYPFFTEEEMKACYDQSCQKMWHQNGLDPSNHGIPSLCAANLWGNIVSEADKAMASGMPTVTLRFGHDTALYRLLSLLGSQTLADGNGDNLYQIVPMAANVQMAFYANSNDTIVAFWLNEKPMRLINIDSVAIQGKPLPYTLYNWSRLKSHFHHYLETQRWEDRVNGINTMVGTAYAVTKSVGIYGKGSEEHGQTLPAVLEPHGMNFWTPQTRDTEKKCIAPYYYPDSLLQGFRASHWIVGGCTQDYGSFTIMPEMDSLRLSPEGRATRFSHEEEVSHPYYYAVHLPDDHLSAEMTATSHAAIFRFTAVKDGEMHIVVNPNNGYQEGFIAIDTARNCIYGYNPVHRIYQGWGERAGFSGWFVVQLQGCNAATVSIANNNDEANPYGYFSIKVNKGKPVLLRAASSFTGIDGAWKNLKAEIPSWDFIGTTLRLDSLWQHQLAKIDVEDSNTAKVNEFYGALYRASYLPHVLSDVDGLHPKFGSTATSSDILHQDNIQGDRPYYGDYSMWDIYRAQLPLLTIIEPQRQSDIMQSLVTKYEEGGWMPIFPCWNSYTAAMIGDHAASALADAWVKGIRGFDVNKAYEGVRKNAFDSPKTFEEYKNGMGRRALKSYLKYGYIPLEDSVMEAFHTKEQVSRTLEYAYDDFCAAQLAKAVGNNNDYKELMRRSSNWKNVFNMKTGWVEPLPTPRRRKGNEQSLNTDLIHRVPYITEGTVMHYSFYVPHDVPGLIKTMGGKKRFIEKLDSLFGTMVSPDSSTMVLTDEAFPFLRRGLGRGSWRNSYYWHGNEPCHQIPYLYALAGQPWKTQWLVKEILRTEYLDVPGGLSGNDDAGQMSTWYVFSSLGFYPVCPGKPEYVIGVPSFRKARIGNLVIESEGISDDKPFIRQTLWNGRPYSSPVITHDMIVNGGTLRFIGY